MLHGSSVPVETGKVQYRARGGFTILENANALTKKHPHPAPLLRVSYVTICFLVVSQLAQADKENL